MGIDRSIAYADLWMIYSISDQYKDQILEWSELPRRLPLYPWHIQVEVLTGAPMPIIKAHAHLLHDRAKQKLGLEPEKPSKQSNQKLWSVLG